MFTNNMPCGFPQTYHMIVKQATQYIKNEMKNMLICLELIENVNTGSDCI